MAKIRVFFLGCLIMGSCMDDTKLNKQKNEIVSTLHPKDLKSPSNFHLFIIGEWEQLNNNCDTKGEDCDSLNEKVYWSFKSEDVKVNNYTLPYCVTNDTIYIAGLPHCVASKQGDTVLFVAVETQEYMWLARKRL